VAGPCEHGNEPWDSLKSGGLFGQLSNYQLLTRRPLRLEVTYWKIQRFYWTKFPINMIIIIIGKLKSTDDIMTKRVRKLKFSGGWVISYLHPLPRFFLSFISLVSLSPFLSPIFLFRHFPPRKTMKNVSRVMPTCTLFSVSVDHIRSCLMFAAFVKHLASLLRNFRPVWTQANNRTNMKLDFM
jgi:hypothetical protein